MFYKMILTARDRWFASEQCTVKSLVNYMVTADNMRDAQIEAIKTYLFLKIGCENRPLAFLFSQGAFNSLNLNEIEVSNNVREYLEEYSAAAVLYEYTCLKNDAGEQVSEKLEKQIKKDPESIDKVFDYERFDYLYLEDTLPEKDRVTLTPRKICEFIKED